MIHNDSEYRKAVSRLSQEKELIQKHELTLQEIGLSDDQIERALAPMRSFYAQLNEEANSYERLKRGEFNELHNLCGLGHLLIMARIAKNMSQKELAQILDVSPSQISRDEKNEYHGVTVERATKILDALGIKLTTKVEVGIESAA